MDEPGNAPASGRGDFPEEDRSPLEQVERLALAGVGAAALTADRIDALATALAEKGGIRREEARDTITSLASRWRGETARMSERAGSGLATVLRELGLVTRDEFEDLELRVAQLEHRLKLVEGHPPSSSA